MEFTGEEMLEELTKVDPSHLNKETRKLFYTIMSVIDERDKYKKLYENEKDHTETLQRIIDRLEVE